MEQQTQKKEWKTPELIVLVRSKPEEAVLAVCKAPPTRTGPHQGDCQIRSGVGNSCTSTGIS
jgi:hypothetical protein